MTSYRLVYSFTSCNVIPILEKVIMSFPKSFTSYSIWSSMKISFKLCDLCNRRQTCSKNLWHILIRMLITSSSYFVKLKYLCNSGRKSWHKMTCVETLLKQFMAYLTLEVKQLITSWQSYVSSYLAQKSFICILLEGTHIHISVVFHSRKLFIIINLIHESTCS